MKSGAKVFIKNEALGKYLFVLRDNKPGIADPNCWGLVGRGVENNESPSEALTREVLEEVGISIFDLRLIHQMIVKHSVNDKNFEVHGYYFSAKTDASLDEIKLNEGQKASFFTLDEIASKDNLAIALKEILLNHRNILE